MQSLSRKRATPNLIEKCSSGSVVGLYAGTLTSLRPPKSGYSAEEDQDALRATAIAVLDARALIVSPFAGNLASGSGRNGKLTTRASIQGRP